MSNEGFLGEEHFLSHRGKSLTSLKGTHIFRKHILYCVDNVHIYVIIWMFLILGYFFSSFIFFFNLKNRTSLLFVLSI